MSERRIARAFTSPAISRRAARSSSKLGRRITCARYCGSAARRWSPLSTREDGEWLCRIAETGKGSCRLTVEMPAAPGRARRGSVASFAPIKRARLDWLVEKATELGVAALAAGMDRAHPGRAGQSRTVAGACDRSGRAERAVVGPGDRRTPERARAAARRLAGGEALAGMRRARQRRADRPKQPRGPPIGPAAAFSSVPRVASRKRSLTLSANSPLLRPRRARPEGIARRDCRARGSRGVPSSARRLAPRPDPLIALAECVD